MKKPIGIIGFGNMGSAIAERIKSEYSVAVFDKDINKTGNLSAIEVAADSIELVKRSEAIILAVKPQEFDGVLNEIKGAAKDKLIISIAAGITTSYIETILKEAKVIRVMPNLPAKIGQAISCLCKGKSAVDKDLEFVEELFRKVGQTLIINEDMMPAATAVSGSGPGFLCDLVEGDSMQQIEVFTRGQFITTLTSTAVGLGFTSKEAKILSEKTGEGTVRFLEVGGVSAQELKKQVASEGGTTEAGLRKLKHNIKNLPAAVKAAFKRAKELSRR